jgi:hypothetical protein
MTSHSQIDLFTRHKVAANLVMILSGIWEGSRINTQLDTSVQSPVILVSQLPTAVTGMLVAPVESVAPAASELLAQWSSIN